MKTLEFAVKDISEGPLDIREIEVSSGEIDLGTDDIKFPGLVYSQIQLLRHDQNIYVKARFSTAVVIYCRRCLEPVQSDIVSNLELQFRQEEEPEKIDPRLIDGGERHFAGETMDLSEDARQAIMLEIPIWPLCSEACKGLCCNCGADLNLSTCSCNKLVQSSSPFMVLSGLSKEDTNRRQLS